MGIFSFFKKERKKKEEPEKENDFKDLLEQIKKDGNIDLVWLLIGHLISSDTLVNSETCNKSISTLNKIIDAVDRTTEYTEEEKEKIKKYCIDGLDICNKELERYGKE